MVLTWEAAPGAKTVSRRPAGRADMEMIDGCIRGLPMASMNTNAISPGEGSNPSIDVYLLT
jgi:hypothetical protein